MQLSSIQDLFPDLDVEGAFETYVAATSDRDPGRFLAWLRDRGLIGPEELTGAAGLLDVDPDATLSTLIHEGGSDQDAETVEVAASAEIRYEPLTEIGAGAMGTVHLARDVHLRRKVALKKLNAKRQSGAGIRRFVSEAQITAQLDHPGIVPVYGLEAGRDGTVAYAMKLVAGRTLREIVDAAARGEDPRPPEVSRGERIEHFLKVCDAVSFAHDKGVVHRDLKPANVMVGRFGEVYLMDWGIARVGSVDEDALLESVVALDGREAVETASGTIVGTPAFMSPEQALGDRDALGPWSDVAALGLMLYELVLLERPYPGKSATRVVMRAAEADKRPPTPGPHAGPPPRELIAIIDKATQLRPEDRYESVRAMADDIRRHLRGDETRALPDNLPRRLRRWVTRHPRATLTALAALIVLGVGAAVGIQLAERARAAEAEIASRERERALAERLASVGERSHGIANHFRFYESLTEGLASATAQALAHAEPIGGPVYDAAAFADPSRSPPGMLPSEHYKGRISADFPVWRAAPDAPFERAERVARQLHHLTPYLAQLFASGPDQPLEPVSPAALAQRIANHEVALEWAYVGLEDPALILLYPGSTANWDESYDPRARPWYQDAKRAWQAGKRRTWSRPYRDLMGQGVVITCLQAIVDAAGRFEGVAAVDLRFDHVVQRYLHLDAPGFVHSALIDEEGDVIATTETTDAPARGAGDALELGRYPVAAVVAGVAEGRSGHHRAGERLYAWARIEHLGWAYVVAFEAL